MAKFFMEPKKYLVAETPSMIDVARYFHRTARTNPLFVALFCKPRRVGEPHIPQSQPRHLADATLKQMLCSGALRRIFAEP
jgi:hypothetical protein